MQNDRIEDDTVSRGSVIPDDDTIEGAPTLKGASNSRAIVGLTIGTGGNVKPASVVSFRDR
jgi:hypothetical protein